ncbi:hypothetical protein BCR44DRAFT_1522108 [Catenaria anguillulae PL171]|uniref:Uncharacterized protein n=1 Tax=Catenaria anguillulae PL171 TaxID=765915 RepID=A0A1Y2HTQ4_9FUNG|nr:hypothetical protein BCR44DRAFT_1522108 [Catenaria anguillulae PL171]
MGGSLPITSALFANFEPLNHYFSLHPISINNNSRHGNGNGICSSSSNSSSKRTKSINEVSPATYVNRFFALDSQSLGEGMSEKPYQSCPGNTQIPVPEKVSAEFARILKRFPTSWVIMRPSQAGQSPILCVAHGKGQHGTKVSGAVSWCSRGEQNTAGGRWSAITCGVSASTSTNCDLPRRWKGLSSMSGRWSTRRSYAEGRIWPAQMVAEGKTTTYRWKIDSEQLGGVKLGDVMQFPPRPAEDGRQAHAREKHRSRRFQCLHACTHLLKIRKSLGNLKFTVTHSVVATRSAAGVTH